MTQIIDLSDININDCSLVSLNSMKQSIAERKEKDSDWGTNIISFEENEIMIKNMFPNKILFTMKEVAALLNTSYEFIRANIVKGKIPCIIYGDRKMINITTVINIVTYGV